MNDFYLQKASLPRSVKNSTILRESLGLWGTERLLNVVDTGAKTTDAFRSEFGRIHRRYANLTFLITQAVPDEKLAYAAETLLVWLQEDFDSASTGAQREAAGICAAELFTILKMYS
jgi:hypothetical protein|tara:strand:+ start:488 stop:838 length:351 start_codon:yes stop_codon:yes gene_type:complete